MTDTDPAKTGLAGSSFRGGICACHASGGYLKQRYKKLSEALRVAAMIPNDTWVYACPSERRTYHITSHPIAGAQYIKAVKP